MKRQFLIHGCWPSFFAALGFPAAILFLLILERTHVQEPFVANDNPRLFKVMVCVVLAAFASIASVITAIAPIHFRHTWRPMWWLIPLELGWVAFVSLFDWASLNR